MDKFTVIKNGEINKVTDSLSTALENMICCIQGEILRYGENTTNYELMYQHDKHFESLVRFPDGIRKMEKRDFHPLLHRIIEAGIFDNEGYLHEINHNLLLLDELEKRKYTMISGNDNFLDLIKYLDVTEFSSAFCPNCKSIQHCTVEGCDGLVSLTCDKCKEVLIDVFRNK